MSKTFIKELREKREMTQEYVAARLGIARPTYADIERGKRDITRSEIKKLAKVFNIPAEALLDEKEPTIHVDIVKSSKSISKKQNTIRISIPQERIEKFKQVLLYILKKVGGKPNVGVTVIYKLLYFIDFDYYEKYEEQLMGLTYIKNHYGPTPVVFDKVLKQMIDCNQVDAVKSKYYKHKQKKYLINPEIEPDLSVLDGREKDHIDRELQRFSDLTAKEFSDLSHKDVPWITAEQGKPIEYESVFYRGEVTSVRTYNNNEAD